MDVVLCESADAKTALINTLNSLRQKEEFLDVTLIIEEKRFKAHKLVLIACSHFFYVMFNVDMIESRQDEITLTGINAAVFNQILEYFYTAKILLNGDNIQDILETASYLQAEALTQTCSEYLLSQIYMDNFFLIATLAEMYHLTKLRWEVYRFILENLLDLSNSKVFNYLTAKQFENIVTQDHFVYFSEATFLRLVLAWFFNVYYPSDDFKILDAKLHAERIIKHIRFDEISHKEFHTILGEFFQNNNSEEELYKDMLTEAYCNKSLLNPRGMKLAIVKVGGVHEIENHEVTFCFPRESKWKYLTSIPEFSSYWDCEEISCYPAVLNNKLYILKSSFCTNVSTKYSPRTDEWKRVPPITVKGRFFYSLNDLGNMLYVVGGAMRDEDGITTQHLQQSERYDPVSNEWYPIKPLPVTIAYHAAASYDFNEDLKLFVSGGFVDGYISPSMYCYTESYNEWHKCAPMLRARLHHKMISIENKLYVCGGYFDNSALAGTIDVYDVNNDSWKILIEVPRTRDYESVVCVDRKIYFLGGYVLSSSGACKPKLLIKSYDIDSELWTVEDDKIYYSQTIAEHDCIALFVPKYLAGQNFL